MEKTLQTDLDNLYKAVTENQSLITSLEHILQPVLFEENISGITLREAKSSQTYELGNMIEGILETVESNNARIASIKSRLALRSSNVNSVEDTVHRVGKLRDSY